MPDQISLIGMPELLQTFSAVDISNSLSALAPSPVYLRNYFFFSTKVENYIPNHSKARGTLDHPVPDCGQTF